MQARSARDQAKSPAQSRAVRRTRPVRYTHSSTQVSEDLRIPIRSSHDIVEAREKGRALAAELEFPSIDRTLITSAISELGRNIVDHADRGEIRLERAEALGSSGIVITATDRGSAARGSRAIQPGSGLTLGLGLPGVKRVMDEFEIVATPRQGTTVTVKKWKPQ